jgi:TRAP-type mannitol/chloroaromatic compound transport system permease large subunit
MFLIAWFLLFSTAASYFSNPDEDGRFLRDINIRTMTAVEGEVKLEIPYQEILRHIKDTCVMKEILLGKIQGHFSPSFSCFAHGCLLLTVREV